MVKSYHLLFFILLTCGITMAQNSSLINDIYFKYDNYKENSITKRRFKHADIVPLIEKLKDNKLFNVTSAGKSAEGRNIYLIKIGTGKTKIFLWSQMHGDEPTATMAIMDLFNFFSSDDEFNQLRNDLLEKTTIYFMPMVNPDGAQVYQRRDALNIDINRDAVHQQTPEGQILRSTFEKINADFGFNLHDQSTYYTAGHTDKSATLSFLAPAMNYEKTINPVRENAIKLIGQLSTILSAYIPGHIARYDDDFEPRAFGDNFQKWGTSTILIESGGWKNDPEKQFIRKMNFIALISSFVSIADKNYEDEPESVYQSIPFNERYLFDLLLRNLKYQNDGHEYLLDIGINNNERSYDGASKFYYKSAIEDQGDLSTFFAYHDYNMDGLEVSLGKIYPETFNTLDEVKKLDFKKLYSEGYTGVVLSSLKPGEKFTELPVNIYLNDDSVDKQGNQRITPNMVIKKDGKVLYVVINGFLYDLKNSTGDIKNGLILK